MAGATTMTIERPFDIAAIRADFPILQKILPEGQPLVYLDNAATAQKPRVVIDKLVEVFEGYNANANRAAHTLAAQVTDEFLHNQACLGVERRKRFVEEHDVWLDSQRPGDAHPLLHAAG